GLRVDEDVALGHPLGPLDPNALRPAVLGAYGGRVVVECDVLLYADVAPPDARRVRVGALERLHGVELRDAPRPLALLDPYEHGLPAIDARRVLRRVLAPPASHVVRAPDDAGADPLRHPRLEHEVADV